MPQICGKYAGSGGLICKAYNENYTAETAGLVTFTEEILNGKLHFLCSVMLLGVEDLLQAHLVCGDEILKNTKQDRLGVTLDNKLNFATNLLSITKNVNNKFIALTRVQKYITTDKKAYIFLIY